MQYIRICAPFKDSFGHRWPSSEGWAHVRSFSLGCDSRLGVGVREARSPALKGPAPTIHTTPALQPPAASTQGPRLPSGGPRTGKSVNPLGVRQTPLLIPLMGLTFGVSNELPQSRDRSDKKG